MLNKKHFVTEINKLSLNFGLKKADDEYLKFMYAELNEEELTNEGLSLGVKIIINEKDKLYSLPSKSILTHACCWGGKTPRMIRIGNESGKRSYLAQKKSMTLEGPSVSIKEINRIIKSIGSK